LKRKTRFWWEHCFPLSTKTTGFMGICHPFFVGCFLEVGFSEFSHQAPAIPKRASFSFFGGQKFVSQPSSNEHMPGKYAEDPTDQQLK